MHQQKEKYKYYNYVLNKWGKYIWRSCVDATLCWGTHDDAVQDISYRLWYKLEDMGVAKFSEEEDRMVRGVVRNVLLEHYRKRLRDKRAITYTSDIQDIETPATDNGSVIDDILPLLDADERNLLELYLQGYEMEAIAKMTGKRYGAVRQRKSRLMKKMKKIYEKQNKQTNKI